MRQIPPYFPSWWPRVFARSGRALRALNAPCPERHAAISANPKRKHDQRSAGFVSFHIAPLARWSRGCHNRCLYRLKGYGVSYSTFSSPSIRGLNYEASQSGTRGQSENVGSKHQGEVEMLMTARTRASRKQPCFCGAVSSSSHLSAAARNLLSKSHPPESNPT